MGASPADSRKALVFKLLAAVLVLGWFGTVLLLVAARGAWWQSQNTHPEQPIAFPHAVHAGRLALDCTFCHTTAETSPVAGAPSVEKCMSCHRSVATERPQIQTLRGYSERREPIRWARVHNLPDFIYFTHKRHVRAGVPCAACHGSVEKMKTARRIRPLQMGWCVTCHRQFGAPTDCATCHQ